MTATQGQTLWDELHRTVNAAREGNGFGIQAVENQMAGRLKRLAASGHCVRHAVGWLTKESGASGLRVLRFKDALDGSDAWGNPALRLTNLRYLDEAVLRFMITLSERSPRGIRAYVASCEGTIKATGARWHAQIHLTEDKEGDGGCGHALLHCHMGTKDAVEEEAKIPADAGTKKSSTRAFSPRVPLPWMPPWDAIDWLLASVEPSLEPAPHQRR